MYQEEIEAVYAICTKYKFTIHLNLFLWFSLGSEELIVYSKDL